MRIIVELAAKWLEGYLRATRTASPSMARALALVNSIATLACATRSCCSAVTDSLLIEALPVSGAEACKPMGGLAIACHE